MKKQILILLVALFALSLRSIGQVNTTAAVSLPPSCTGDETQPAIGQSYTYEVAIPAVANFAGSGTYDWYITQNTNLLTNNAILTSGTDFVADGTYHAGTGNKKTIAITWNASALTNGNPYYLVIKYSETNGTCSPENMRVYRIKPRNTFWLKMEPANADGTTTNAPIAYCPPSVSTATVTEGATAADAKVEYTYGTTTMYALISAGGYTGEWDANLQLSNLADDQTIASISYSGTATGSGTFTAPSSITYGSGAAGVWTAKLKATAGTTPEPILVTIVINNNHHQGLTDQKINVAIDGSFASGAYKDLSDVGGACTPEADYADYVGLTINARPTINPTTPASFIASPTEKQ